MRPLFTETQRFNQWWIWLIILLSSGVPFVVFVQQIILGKTFGTNPISDTAVVLMLLLPLAIILLFYMIRLQTNITHETLSFRFIPFVKRTIPWSEIASFKMINYGFVGGYGIRLTMKYGTVYNIKGKEGLFVKLKNGKTFVIGTQKPEELERAIEQLKK